MNQRKSIMKILFITNVDVNDISYGGGKGARSRIGLIKKIGDTDLLMIRKKSTFRSILSILQGLYPPLTLSDIHRTIHICQRNPYDIIFLDTSVYGTLAWKIKKTGIKTMLFGMFQNCELDYNEVRFNGKRTLKSIIYKFLVKRSENAMLEFCDINASFSERDAKRIEELYGKKIDLILPLFIKDEARPEDLVEYTGEDGYCLLFGPATPPNIEGFKWFTKNVSPYINIKTVVAGKNIERFKHSFKYERVEIIGYVNDIHNLYKKAKFVCLPLLSGSGMKVKTIEAMMFGKSIFGTNEAFSGFDKDYKEAGYLCNTPNEFIQTVNNFLTAGNSSLNMKSRQIYEDKYSERAAFSMMKDALNIRAQN